MSTGIPRNEPRTDLTLLHQVLDPQHGLLVDVEVDVNRIEADDRGEHRIIGLDQATRVNHPPAEAPEVLARTSHQSKLSWARSRLALASFTPASVSLKSDSYRSNSSELIDLRSIRFLAR